MTPLNRLLCASAFALVSLPAFSADYAVDIGASEIRFSGIHAERNFTGTFSAWSAQISFDPNDLAGSKLSASFDPTSAATGNPQYDGALPTGDWFVAKTHPEVTYTSESITANGDGTFKATGTLTIRDIAKPVTFDFTLSDLSKAPVTATAEFVVLRLDYDMGLKSDPKIEWVSNEITMNLKIVASPSK